MSTNPTPEPFRFKNVRNGEPIDPSEIPKLPPAALRVIYDVLDKHDESTSAHKMVRAMSEIAREVVTVALQRLDPTITSNMIERDEDYAEVARLYEHLRKTNPAVFPVVSAAEEAPVSPLPDAAEDAATGPT